jgi:hypothetical protein
MINNLGGNMNKFYMIYVEGGSMPVNKHKIYEDAKIEAGRMCIKTKKPVIIIEAISGFEIPEPELVEIRITEEI